MIDTDQCPHCLVKLNVSKVFNNSELLSIKHDNCPIYYMVYDYLNISSLSFYTKKFSFYTNPDDINTFVIEAKGNANKTLCLIPYSEIDFQKLDELNDRLEKLLVLL